MFQSTSYLPPLRFHCVGKMKGLNQGLLQRLHRLSHAPKHSWFFLFFPNQMSYICCQIPASLFCYMKDPTVDTPCDLWKKLLKDWARFWMCDKWMNLVIKSWCLDWKNWNKGSELLTMKPLIVSQVIYSMSTRVIIVTNELKGEQVYMEKRMLF